LRIGGLEAARASLHPPDAGCWIRHPPGRRSWGLVSPSGASHRRRPRGRECDSLRESQLIPGALLSPPAMGFWPASKRLIGARDPTAVTVRSALPFHSNSKSESLTRGAPRTGVPLPTNSETISSRHRFSRGPGHCQGWQPAGSSDRWPLPRGSQAWHKPGRRGGRLAYGHSLVTAGHRGRRPRVTSGSAMTEDRAESTSNSRDSR
jgi:hypothetical protein